MFKRTWYVFSWDQSVDLSADERATGRSTNAIGRIRRLSAWLLVWMVIGTFTSPQAHAVQLIASQDTWVSELAPNTITGADGALMQFLSVRRNSTQLNLIYIKFDISTLTEDFARATLKMTAQKANVQFNLFAYGAFEDNAGAWDETAVTYNTTAVLFPDGVLSSPESLAGHTVLDQFDLVPMSDLNNANAKVSELGSAVVPAAALDTLSTFTSPELATFVNTARAGGDATVSLLLASDSNIQNYYSKDGTTNDAFKPTLELNLAEPGDYNANGVVDGADYVAWRKNQGLTGGATVAQGDGTGDGNVTDADYTYWRERFGNPTSGGGSGLGGSTVPETSALALVLLGVLTLGASCHRQAQSNRKRGFAARFVRDGLT